MNPKVKNVLKILVGFLAIVYFVSFGIKFLIVSSSVSYPSIPDETHSYALHLRGKGIHYLSDSAARFYKLADRISWPALIPLLAFTALLQLTKKKDGDTRKSAG